MPVQVQLPREITRQEVSRYLNNDAFAISQKMDGHRIIVKTAPLMCYTRQGLEREVPPTVRRALAGISTEWTFDGEILDKTYHCFDILSTSKGDVRSWSWHQRQAVLAATLGGRDDIMVVPQHLDDKPAFFEKCMAEQVEGVVFANVNAPYRGGRALNALLKFKFVKDIDCVVVGRGDNGKDNLTLAVYRMGDLVEVGRVSALTGDGPNVEIGDVVTVTVLYTTASGRLYQPVKPKIRTDKSATECTYEQIINLQTNKRPVA